MPRRVRFAQVRAVLWRKNLVSLPPAERLQKHSTIWRSIPSLTRGPRVGRALVCSPIFCYNYV
jgi:hypothetical protein